MAFIKNYFCQIVFVRLNTFSNTKLEMSMFIKGKSVQFRLTCVAKNGLFMLLQW